MNILRCKDHVNFATDPITFQETIIVYDVLWFLKSMEQKFMCDYTF